VALIFVSKRGENSIAVTGGANDTLSPADVRRARRAIANASILIVQLETPIETVRAAANLARQSNTRVILNPAPARQLPHSLLRQVSVLTPNESEAETLTGIRIRNQSAARRASTHLLNAGVGMVIITLGKRGAWLATSTQQRLIGGFKVAPVDTTAAGDVFNGALAVALGEGRPVEVAVRFANAAAALSVTRPGAQPSVPRRAAIDRMLSSR
jgi:ribokinase